MGALAARARGIVVATLMLRQGATASPTAPTAADAIQSYQASTHPMRYHVALPSHWSAAREWPVLVVIPDAARDFVPNLERFVGARGERPYILVAPEVLTSGGSRTHTLEYFSYSKATWDSLQGRDEFAFDDAGVDAVLADVRRQWHGESKALLTGWEAGGHTVFALAFRRPELWRGVAPVSPNYQRRGVDPKAFRATPARSRIALQVFRAGAPDPEFAAAMKSLDAQTATALDDARARGFRPAPVRVVAGAPHGPLVGAVLAWCDSLTRGK